MSKKIIQDVFEVLVTDVKSGKIVMFGEAQTTGIAQTMTENRIKGGIGNKTVFLLRSDKEITLNVTSATFDTNFFALTQGVTVNPTGTLTVTKEVKLPVVSNAGTLEVTIPSAPTGLATAEFVDVDGKQSTVAVASGVITVPTGAVAVANDEVFVYYKQDVTGKSIELNSNKFSGKYKIEMRTISYSVDSAEVDADIYYQFYECIPTGAFTMSLQNGQPYAPEISFMVMNPIGSDVMGEYIEVAR